MIERVSRDTVWNRVLQISCLFPRNCIILRLEKELNWASPVCSEGVIIALERFCLCTQLHGTSHYGRTPKWDTVNLSEMQWSVEQRSAEQPGRILYGIVDGRQVWDREAGISIGLPLALYNTVHVQYCTLYMRVVHCTVWFVDTCSLYTFWYSVLCTVQCVLLKMLVLEEYFIYSYTTQCTVNCL